VVTASAPATATSSRSANVLEAFADTVMCREWDPTTHEA
jgi:hypothetical protein